jgi:hypothetical protein
MSPAFVVVAANPANKDEGTTLSKPVHPNDLWCAEYKGEFKLADRALI